MRKSTTLAFAALAWAATVSQTALAEITNCTPISSVPFTINVPGIYCVTTDLTTAITTGAAITINANVVTIDLNGRRLGGGLAGTGTRAVGIFADNLRNITVRNGTIRGFGEATSLTNSGGLSNGHVIEEIRADGNTETAIQLMGSNSVVHNNQVSNTGGTTADDLTLDHAFGIAVVGASNRIINNDVTHSFASKADSWGTGIFVSGANAIVKDNRVSDLASVLSDTYGIWADAAQRALIVGNQINGSSNSGAVQVGIFLNGSANVIVRDNLITGFTDGINFASSTGVYSDNIIQGAATAYSGGTAHGTTNFP